MDNIDVLSKRFKDFIDKVQAAYDKAGDQKPDAISKENPIDTELPVKLYTVVSPIEAMTNNLKSVLNAIDKAIDNIDKLQDSEVTGEDLAEKVLHPQTVREVINPDLGQRKFTEEELDYIVRTFNKILNATEEERKKLFMHIDSADIPPENGS